MVFSKEVKVITEDKQNKLRRYLLGELPSADEEQVELRLMTDADYIEEFEIIEEEIIEQYVNDALSVEERVRVKESFFNTPQRRNKLRFALALKGHKPPPEKSKFRTGRFFTFYLPLAAAALIILAGSIGIWRIFFYQSDVAQGLASLRTAFKEQRPTEARITDFNYAPAITQRGAKLKVDYLSRDRAANLLLKAVDETPNAQSYHALGQLYLAEHQFAKARDQFKMALGLNPQSAQINSDLGATLLEEGKLRSLETEQSEGIEEFALSLGYFNKALELDPELLEALFNRALLYQALQLPRPAEENWRAYLAKDLDSKWAEEARAHLKLLEEQKQRAAQTDEEVFQNFLRASERGDDETSWTLIRSSHHRAGNMVIERLLDTFLAMSTEGQKDMAAEQLRLLSYVGKLAGQRTGDRFFSDLSRFYQSTTPPQRTLLAEARRLMKSGHAAWGRSTVEETRGFFSHARQLFNEASDDCETHVADYWLGLCDYRDYRSSSGLSTFEALDLTGKEKQYHWMRVRALYGGSLIQSDLNEYSKAIQYMNSSLELAEQIGDSVGTLNALTGLIEYHRHLGNYHQSLRFVQRSLPIVNSISLDPVQGCRHYGFEAAAFASLGLYAAAADFQKEAVLLALSANNPTAISINYASLGVLYGKLQNYSEGISNIRKAFEIASARPTERASQEMIAYSTLLMGDLYRQLNNLEQAVSNYDRSIELYKSLKLPAFQYQAHKGRLLCYVAQKNDDLVQEEIETTLKLVEDNRIKIFEEDYRNKFFDAEHSVYDQAIDFAYARLHDPDKAFDYSESSRARSLLDLMNSDERLHAQQQQSPLSISQPLPLSEITSRLPEHVQLLQYAVLEDKVLIWSISREGKSTGVKEISQEDLNAKVLSFVQDISSPSESLRESIARQAKELHEILIKPIESSLDKSKQICIIPDKILNYLPFGALVSPVTGTYFLADYSLLMSPSATVLMVCSEMAAQKRLTSKERILSVGNPRLNKSAYQNLPDLPSAAREASEVAEFYELPLSLTGANASADEVRKGMNNVEVIHMALHTILDERFPTRSKLLLSDKPSETGDQRAAEGISADEIYKLRLSTTRLVVLSACQTGAERYYRGEGMISMARPFIAAGVPLVAASLWEVDSNSTANLMISFHRHRKLKNLSTVESLKSAQLEMINGADERLRQPYYWAAFVVIGGYAEF